MNKQVDDDISDAGRNTPFQMVSDMENDIASLIDYGHVIARVADTLNEDDAGPVSRLGYLIVKLAESVEHRRGLLFQALHPNRAELDAEAKANGQRR